MKELIFEQESKILLGIAIQLHKELGCGFKEKLYQDAFEVLLRENNIPYSREKHITLSYHGTVLEHDFYYDFLCWDKIGVELKATKDIYSEFEAQIINYLRVSEHKLGVIFNYGKTSLEYKWYPNKMLLHQD